MTPSTIEAYTAVPQNVLVEHPGKRPRAVAKHSYYNVKLQTDGLRGNSRRWGDASLDVQRTTIREIVQQSKQASFSLDLTALTLAIARVESGFNPDAAAGSTSASGIGQFIKRTGRAYGITDQNRFSMKESVRALVAHTKENFERAAAYCSGKKDSCQLEYTYALHHDGPSLAYGGKEIAQEKVMPWKHRFADWLSASDTSVETAHTPRAQRQQPAETAEQAAQH